MLLKAIDDLGTLQASMLELTRMEVSLGQQLKVYVPFRQVPWYLYVHNTGYSRQNFLSVIDVWSHSDEKTAAKPYQFVW